jgi:hypothetical protein
MAYRILVFGASYGSLFATKCLMAGHDVTLVCRPNTAALINVAGTSVYVRLKGELTPRHIASAHLPGRLDARPPGRVDPAGYELAVLAMQEPQYADPAVSELLRMTGKARLPCLSLMNMPPLPYLRRLGAIDTQPLESAFTDPRVWDPLDPQLVTLCSPDPQAFRPVSELANVVHVSLATNFKVAAFDCERGNVMLNSLAADIEKVRLVGVDVPVKLRVHASPYVALAKWPMLMTGNYRCVTTGTPVSIRDVVHANIKLSREVYGLIGAIAMRIGAQADQLVPFEKYIAAVEQLVKPSSVARALAVGATAVERVDKLVQRIGRQFGMSHPVIDRTVALTDAAVDRNTGRFARAAGCDPSQLAQALVADVEREGSTLH